MIVERTFARYECDKCTASFEHLSMALAHNQQAHMRDSATQYDLPQSNYSPQLQFNDSLLAELSEQQSIVSTPPRKRRRSSGGAPTRSAKIEQLYAHFLLTQKHKSSFQSTATSR